MSKCVPGMPCYDETALVYRSVTYPNGCNCSTNYSTNPLSSSYIYYAGANLPNSGINTEDVLTTAIQKIDEKLAPSAIFDAFIDAINNDAELMALFCEKVNACIP